jgi:hypothetical protein
MGPVSPDLLVPPAHFGFLASPLLVVLLGILVPGLGLAVALGRALSSRAWKSRVDRAMAGESGSLVRGPKVLVGEVMTDDADSPEPGVAIKILISQHVDGMNAREANRQTLAGPFYLKTQGGEMVRVEPGPSPTLAAPLETEPSAGRTALLRYRAAVLRQGERALCAGHLSRGFNPRANGTYRAAEGGWVLSAGRGRSMWVSGDGLASVFERQARFFFLYAAAFAALFLAAQITFLPFYRLSAGESVRCTVSGVETGDLYDSTLRSRHRPPSVLGTCEDGSSLSEAARPALVELVGASQGVRVTRIRAGQSTMLGPVPTVSWLRIVGLCVLFVVVLALASALAGRSSRAWYERRKVVESLNPIV